MLFAHVDGGGLELRRSSGGGARLSGRFPYGKRAVLSDGGRTGRPQKEVIEPRAFAFRVNEPTAEIHLLAGHSFDAPLASKLNGSLRLKDSDEALTFDANITPEIADVSFVRDVLALITAGLAVGLSPGFRLPPKRRVAEPEFVEQEPDDGSEDEDGNPQYGAVIRHVREALLYELSIVTRPAYDQAQVEMRNWNPTAVERTDSGLYRALNRWRA